MTEAPLLETYAQLPFPVTRGDGAYIMDASGRRYLDLYGGHAVALLGHSRPEIADALSHQARELLFYSNVARMDVRDRAAARLIEFADCGLRKVFFCNSGAEANENALKLAVQKTGRSKLASFTGGWHGRSLLCAAVTDDPKWHASLPGWIGPVERLAPNAHEELRKIDESVAAVILEPIQSIAGVIAFDHEFLKALRTRCDEVGAWLIFDEVQTAIVRLGRPFVAGSSGTTPDISTTAKALANGVPIGALLCSEKVAATVKQGDLGSTFGGGPLAMVAMEATLDIVEREKLVAHAAHLGEYARGRLLGGEVVEVRGEGCLLGLRMNRPVKPVYQALLERGIITGTSGDPNVLRLLPPVTITTDHLDELRGALDEIAS